MQTARQKIGIGVRVRQLLTGQHVITEMVPGSAAANSPMAVGEIIKSIDEVDCSYNTTDQLADLLLGQEGSVVKVVTIARGGQTKTVLLERGLPFGEPIDGSPPKTVSTLQFAPQMQQNNALVHGGANFMSINAGYNVAHQSLGQRPVEQIRHVQGAEMAPPPAPVPPQTQYGVRRLSPQPSVIMAQPAMKGANDNLPTAIRGPQFHSKFVTPQATNVPGPGMLHMSIPAQQADQPASGAFVFGRNDAIEKERLRLQEQIQMMEDLSKNLKNLQVQLGQPGQEGQVMRAFNNIGGMLGANKGGSGMEGANGGMGMEGGGLGGDPMNMRPSARNSMGTAVAAEVGAGNHIEDDGGAALERRGSRKPRSYDI